MFALYHANRSHRRAVSVTADRRDGARPERRRVNDGAAIGAMRDALPWLDVDGDGMIAQAGIVRPHGETSDRATPERDHPALDALAAFVRREGGQAGRIAAHGADCLFWFTPAPRGGDGAVRGLAIGIAVFGDLVDRYHPDRGVTAAEKRALFQLVAGSTLRAAAVADGVSVETKRAQIKSLCVKLGCSGQIDLVRRAMGQLVHLLHATGGP